MRDRVQGLLRGGLAFTLVGTLMVPSTAAFATSDERSGSQDAESAAAQATAADSESQATASSEDAAVDGDGSDGDEKVTIIVQLEDDGTQGVSLLSYVMGTEAQDRHSYFKDEIRELAANAVAEEEGSSGEDGALLLSTDVDGAADAIVDEVHDYYNVIDGFAVKAPASTLDEIQELDGVKAAFIEQEYDVPTDAATDENDATEGETEESALKNQASLDITQADDVEQKGDGQVIAVIDSGLDTSHEAFSGDLYDSTVALTEDAVSAAKQAMTGGGANGAYVSEKIAFAYDYADGDADVVPGISGLEHGTHVAGIAAANGGDQIRGTAPNAQLAIMKVASDSSGSIYDSALLAAMDDLKALGVDSVNISIGAEAGFSDEGAGTYTDAINSLESAGITVNVAAGNSYSSGYKNQSGEDLPYATDPDSSVASTPSTVSGSFAVASMNTDAVEVEDTSTYITASDGTQMEYWEAKDPSGNVRGQKFADLADGDYEVVWADAGRTSGSGNYYGDVDPNTSNSLDGKIALVYGHQDLFGYGSVIAYSRSAASMSALGAEAVIIYDPTLTEADLADICLDDDGWYDQNMCPVIFVTAEDGEALKSIDKSTRSITKGTASRASASITAADGTSMAYTEVGTNGNVSAVSKFSDLDDGDYEYVWCGIARTSGDYEGVDYDGDIDGDWSKLNGKVALVQGNRWFLYESNIYSYDQMVQRCMENGAIAVVIFDDRYATATDVTFYDDGWLSTTPIPTILVGYDDGVALRDAVTKTFTKTTSDDGGNTESYYTISNFSSWGVTPDLKLKPEISAPGGNVYSSIPNNQYAYYSGTSMAAPQMTGIAALVRQYVESDEKFAYLSDTSKSQVITQLLMSTAVPMADVDDLDSYYSPRQQGAGVANVVAATTSEVYATVDGAEDASRPKADLGESEQGTWTFTVTLHNLGSTDHTYTPDTAALSDTVADGLFQQQMKNWTGAGISVSYSGDAYNAADGTVSVPAKGIANYTVTITCEDAFKAFASESTPNGTFVDGFAMLKTVDEDGVDLSVPFVGFYGDWSDAPVFDAAADEGYHAYGTKLIDGVWSETLGVNPFDESENPEVDMDRVVISNSGADNAPTTLTTSTGLLRNANNLTYEVTNPSGESEGVVSYDYVRKTYYSTSYSMHVPAESLLSGYPVFNPEAGETETAEGVYTLTQTATTAGPTPEQQSQSLQFIYDTTAPEITDVVYSDNNGDPTLTFTVVDNSYLAAIDFVAQDENGITRYSRFYRAVTTDDPIGTDENGNNIFQVTVRVSDVTGGWSSKYGSEKEITNTVRAYAWDYGLLVSDSSTAVLTPVEATSVTLGSDELAVAPGQNAGLSATVAPEDTTDTELVWSSSDESVATVDSNGVVTGVSEGDATVTVAVKNHPELTDTVAVKVASVGSETGVVLSNDSMRIVKYDSSSQIAALLSEDMQGASVTWESSDTEVFTVEAAADDAAKATLTGGYQVGDATLTVTVEKDGAVKTATASIQNRTEDYDDFIIDENHVLQGYTGSKTTIVVPNDVTAIGDYAFYGDLQIERIGIPASVQSIGSYAFGVKYEQTDYGSSSTGRAKEFAFEDTEEHPSQLTTIADRAFSHGGVAGYMTLPSSLTTLGEYAFESCLSLSGVYLPDSLREIPTGAFKQCVSLSDLTMSDNVTSIGTDAFSTCLFLEQIKLHSTAEGASTEGLPSKLEVLGGGSFSATYLGASGSSVITIPGTVKHIGEGAFSGDRFITGIVINDGVESIGYSAFGGTSITSLTLPDSVTSIATPLFTDTEYLEEVTLSRNLEADCLDGAFAWCFSLKTINVPEDALNYTAKDGVLYNKDMTKLIFCPTTMTGTLDIPEGVTTIAYNAFESSNLSAIEFPETLTNINKSGVTRQLDVVDLGTNIVEISQDAFRQNFYAYDEGNTGYTPAHLIVRGGQDGSYADTKYATQQQTAYFGEGMTSLDFSLSGAPGILVVPSDLEALNLSGNASNPTAVTVYAPAESAGYEVAKAALEAIGADPATQLKEYTPLAVTVTLGDIPQAGAAVTVSAEATGGVDGAKEYRFVQQNADGTETVVQDWQSVSTATWTVPQDGTVLRVDVRDATMLTASAAFGPEAPVFTTNVSATPASVLVGGTVDALTVEATVEEGASLTYQWYCNDAAIDGATAASYTPSADAAGTYEYYCVATSAKDGLTAAAKSQVATVKVVAQAAAPAISVDLPLNTQVATGDSVVLTVSASSEQEGAVLSYQWYCDGAALEGATGTTYRPGTATAGTHTYYVVVTSTVGLADNTASVRSGNATVVVSESLFTDVADSGAWYFAPVNAAAKLGYMSGYAGTYQFGPDDTLTRGQAACVLGNMAGGGVGSTAYSGEFADVEADAYYAGSVAWAKAAGVMNGYSGSQSFGPDDNLTREQMACALYNYAKNVAGEDVTVDVDAALASFSADDVTGVSDWARTAVAWAVDRDIMGNGGFINAQDDISRAEMAAMAVNYQPEARF